MYEKCYLIEGYGGVCGVYKVIYQPRSRTVLAEHRHQYKAIEVKNA